MHRSVDLSNGYTEVRKDGIYTFLLMLATTRAKKPPDVLWAIV